jgi:hypothetical protein
VFFDYPEFGFKISVDKKQGDFTFLLEDLREKYGRFPKVCIYFNVSFPDIICPCSFHKANVLLNLFWNKILNIKFHD